MAERAAHLVGHVLPDVPARQTNRRRSTLDVEEVLATIEPLVARRLRLRGLAGDDEATNGWTGEASVFAELAAASVDGRAARGLCRGGRRLPVRPQLFLDRLANQAFSNPSDLVAASSDLARGPDAVTRRRRLAHLALAALPPAWSCSWPSSLRRSPAG
jgi:hypothetical protein